MLIGIDGNEANVKNRVGTGTYAFELLKQFSKIKLSRHSGEQSDSRILKRFDSGQARMTRFIVYLKEPPIADLPKENSNFKYKVFGPKKLWTQFALPLRLTVGGPKLDVFFSTAHYGPRFSKVPYVVTIHDLSYLHFPELFKKDDLMQLTFWSKYSIEKSTHIIVPSQATKDDIVQNYNILPAKISVTYEGYDKERFKPAKKAKIESVKTRYKIKGDYVIFVGTLQPRKNIERLIEAFKSVVNSLQLTVHSKEQTVNRQPSTVNLSLVIAGKKGWMYEPILSKANELGIGDRVVFTDFILDEDLPALISGAQLYINPSLWEGFGIPLVEAQACGVPVCVSNTSSLPEILNKSGLTFNPESVDEMSSSMITMLTDDKLREVFIKKGTENTKRFSWQNCAQETLKVLEKAVLPTYS